MDADDPSPIGRNGEHQCAERPAFNLLIRFVAAIPAHRHSKMPPLLS
jgi:hypothetical protein